MQGITVGDKTSKFPIIQGGMGVGVSMHKLAGTVAKEGGIGIISAADIGYQEEDFDKNPLEANLRAIGKEIIKAREIAGDSGIVGINIMVALSDYAEIVKESVKQKVDLIISGAGLPKDLPVYVKGTKTQIAPVVSSARACKLITEMWMKKYDYVPDMIVVEGPEAGGHLGFKVEELEKEIKIEDITREVVEYIKEVEKKANKKIPVISAGGIFDGNDIKKMLEAGASGVQMATRFVATDECDAAYEFKKAYVDAKKEDVKIIKSPVGMPGRAIYNEFLKKISLGTDKITRCYRCIKSCDLSSAKYCITKALVNAVKGDVNEGLIFCGSNVDKINKIVPVHELMQELVCEFE